jgi:hypothetical protein
MKREEFVKWLDEKSGFKREFTSDDDWEEMVDYADYRFDYLEVKEDKVIFRWEELYWGGSSMRNDEYEFEDFIRKYEDYELRY